MRCCTDSLRDGRCSAGLQACEAADLTVHTTQVCERVSAQRVRLLDDDLGGYGFAQARARTETPLSRRFHRLEIQAKHGIQRARDLYVSDRAVRLDDALEEDGALHFGAHRV